MKELSLHILDIAQNSIVAGASIIEIYLNENTVEDELIITIDDNGKGIPESILCKVLDPYTTSRTTRKVGMGLPLLNDACKITGGQLSIQSAEGKGTSVLAKLGLNHFDRQPIGDIAGVMVILISSNPNIRFIYKHIKDGNEFVLDSQEVKDVLEGVPISAPEVGRMLKEMINLNLDEL